MTTQGKSPHGDGRFKFGQGAHGGRIDSDIIVDEKATAQGEGSDGQALDDQDGIIHRADGDLAKT